MEYDATGVGDLTIRANIDSLNDELNIEDNVWWDNGAKNRINLYNLNNVTTCVITHEHDYYLCNKAEDSRDFIDLNVNSLTTPYVFETDFYKGTCPEYVNVGITAYQSPIDNQGNPYNSIEILQFSWNYGMAKYVNYAWEEILRTNGMLQNNWYKFRLTVTENNVLGEIINTANNSVVYSKNVNYNAIGDNWNYSIHFRSRKTEYKFKNVKLKKLTS